ncbi:hypothetical protein ABTM91_20640, partial [Acinetobacter baumannii]
MVDTTVDEGKRPAASGRKVSRGRMAVVFILAVILLAAAVGGLYAFDQFRQKMIAQFIANMKP